MGQMVHNYKRVIKQNKNKGLGHFGKILLAESSLVTGRHLVEIIREEIIIIKVVSYCCLPSLRNLTEQFWKTRLKQVIISFELHSFRPTEGVKARPFQNGEVTRDL